MNSGKVKTSYALGFGNSQMEVDLVKTFSFIDNLITIEDYKYVFW